MRLNRRNKFLIFGFVSVLGICYSFAISNTIKYYIDYKSKKEVLDSDNDNPILSSQLNQKEQQLDQLLSKYKSNNEESFQNNLLKQLNIYCSVYDLKIINFVAPHIFNDTGSIITTYSFSVQGTFNNCLLMVNKVENNPSIGNVKHLNFVKNRNYKSNLDELSVEVILQKSEEK